MELLHKINDMGKQHFCLYMLLDFMILACTDLSSYCIIIFLFLDRNPL